MRPKTPTIRAAMTGQLSDLMRSSKPGGGGGAGLGWNIQ
jgi:hypothetical protein